MASSFTTTTLAPTMGQRRLLEFIFGRASSTSTASARCALVQRIYNMDFINDNAGCFANGGKFLQNGRTIEFGSHRVCTVPVEVMMASAVGAGKEAVEEGAGRTASTRAAKPPLEHDAGAAGASSVPPETPLQVAMHTLATPIAQNIDPAKAQAELEATQGAAHRWRRYHRAQRELNDPT
ncbi:hypothetical protein QYE76_009809 [Lolium multiflorum]|uniref:Uncharacterized protein n=1 Tax=Lolium multiflorum TaxID=4521 RepID=A0AAD8TUB7_LOLMU|nr:hypothetical protein QYE76_009809 [Lolium multiflorum]